MVYEYHPACLLLPRMGKEEFASLRASIKAGFDSRFPIILLDGKILDGRHRYEACIAEGVTPEFVDQSKLYSHIDPYDYVRKVHGARRSWLSQEQKVIVCGRLINSSVEYLEKQAEVRDTNHAVKRDAKLVKGKFSVPVKKDKSAAATRIKAAMIEVTKAAVERAAFIERHSSELADKVADGLMKASTAIAQIKKDMARNKTKALAELEMQGGKLLEGDLFKVIKKVGDGSVDLIYADPPYSDLEVFDLADCLAAVERWMGVVIPKLKPTGRLYLCAPVNYQHELFDMMKERGFYGLKFVQTAVRYDGMRTKVKNKNMYRPCYTPIFYLCGQKAGNLPGMAGDFWMEDSINTIIASGSKPGELVLDPFAGGGAVGEVAKQLGRGFILIEKDPSLCEAAKGRINVMDNAT